MSFGLHGFKQGFHADRDPGGVGGRVIGFDAKIRQMQFLFGETFDPMRFHVVGQAGLPYQFDDAFGPIIRRHFAAGLPTGGRWAS